MNSIRAIASAALTALCGLLSPAAKAANPVFNNPDNRIYWGMRASVDFSIPMSDMTLPDNSKTDLYKNGTGVSVGAICNIPLVANLYFEPGLSFFYNSYSYDVEIADNGGEIVSSNPRIKKYGLRLPLLVGYRFDVAPRFAFSLFTGPELDYSFAGKVKFKNEENIDDPELDDVFKIFGKDGQQRPFNIAWDAGVSFEIDYSLCIGLNWSFGLNNLHKLMSVPLHEYRATVFIGYNF